MTHRGQTVIDGRDDQGIPDPDEPGRSEGQVLRYGELVSGSGEVLDAGRYQGPFSCGFMNE